MQIDTEYIARKYLLTNPEKRQISSRKFYCILFVSKGHAICHHGDHKFRCNTESIIILKPWNTIELEYVGGKSPLEILFTGFAPELLDYLSSEEIDLENCFNVVPFSCINVEAEPEITMLIKNLTRSLTRITPETKDFGTPLYAKSMMTMLIILILRACIHAETKKRSDSRKHLMLDDIFVYIRSHITEEITLEQLEKEFYVSKFHISREFKKRTGITIHQYIIKSKLDFCKHYIEQGKPIVEVYKLCGFGGYNHLFRAFKKEFGITPKEYYHQVTKNKE